MTCLSGRFCVTCLCRVSSPCERFCLLFGCDVIVDGIVMRFAMFSEMVRFGVAAAAGLRDEWLPGTWIPKEGKDSDLRRVLYGILSVLLDDCWSVMG